MAERLIIYNANLVDANISKKKSAILIEDGKIAGFPEKDAVKKMIDEGIPHFNAQGCAVMPSFVDMHAHFRDPGFTEKEDIESGCYAAAAGGYGVVMLMPNTNPVISSQKDAVANNNKAKKINVCRTIQAVSITKDFDGKTISHLAELNSKTIPVISEDGKEVQDSNVMLNAMKIAAKKKITVACHCEDPFLASEAKELRAQKKISDAEKILELAEDVATFRNLRLAKEAGCHIHLCHVSTAACVEAAKKAKESGVDVTFEVTPHHIALSGQKKSNQAHIVNPPLRSELNRMSLIKSLKDGSASCIATDHAPHTFKDKENGAPGFSGLETSFATCYTTLVKGKVIELKKLSELMSYNPAKILGLENIGLLAEGFDANLTIVDTEKEWVVCGEEFASKGKYTPLEGKKLFGVIKATFYKGEIVFQE